MKGTNVMIDYNALLGDIEGLEVVSDSLSFSFVDNRGREETFSFNNHVSAMDKILPMVKTIVDDGILFTKVEIVHVSKLVYSGKD